MHSHIAVNNTHQVNVVILNLSHLGILLSVIFYNNLRITET